MASLDRSTSGEGLDPPIDCHTPFEESQVCSRVTADDAPSFFREHGIFYQADAEIAKHARSLPESKELRREWLMKDPRFAKILEPFIDNPPAPVLLGHDQGKFFAFTTKPNQDHRVVVYVWPGETVIDFFDQSHKGLNKGVPASNGRDQIPYSWLRDKDKRGLQEHRVVMREGGIMVVHLNLALHVEKGPTANGLVFQQRHS